MVFPHANAAEKRVRALRKTRVIMRRRRGPVPGILASKRQPQMIRVLVGVASKGAILSHRLDARGSARVLLRPWFIIGVRGRDALNGGMQS